MSLETKIICEGNLVPKDFYCINCKIGSPYQNICQYYTKLTIKYSSGQQERNILDVMKQIEGNNDI